MSCIVLRFIGRKLQWFALQNSSRWSYSKFEVGLYSSDQAILEPSSTFIWVSSFAQHLCIRFERCIRTWETFECCWWLVHWFCRDRICIFDEFLIRGNFTYLVRTIGSISRWYLTSRKTWLRSLALQIVSFSPHYLLRGFECFPEAIFDPDCNG